MLSKLVLIIFHNLVHLSLNTPVAWTRQQFQATTLSTGKSTQMGKPQQFLLLFFVIVASQLKNL